MDFVPQKDVRPRRIDRHIARSRFHLNTKLMTENLPTSSLARDCKPGMSNKRKIVLCLDQNLPKKAKSWLQPVKNLRKRLETTDNPVLKRQFKGYARARLGDALTQCLASSHTT